MAKYTENFNLIKPEDDEYYDVADFNENMDIIDEALSENSGASEQLQGIISPDGQGVRIVKSIQRVNFSQHDGSSYENGFVNVSFTIQTVDPARSIVLVHRVQDYSSASSYLSFTLKENSLNVGFYKSNSQPISATFQIMEFY